MAAFISKLFLFIAVFLFFQLPFAAKRSEIKCLPISMNYLYVLLVLKIISLFRHHRFLQSSHVKNLILKKEKCLHKICSRLLQYFYADQIQLSKSSDTFKKYPLIFFF